jgi:hypothetical protein
MIRIHFDPEKIGGSVLLGETDIVDLAGLKAKLRTETPLAAYLRTQLSPMTRERLENSDDGESPQLRQTLVADLNRVLKEATLFESRRFRKIELTDRTRYLAKLSLEGEGLVCLNRSLLGDAFRNEIARSQKAEWEAWTLLAQNETLKVIGEWEEWKRKWDEWKLKQFEHQKSQDEIPKFQPAWNDDVWKGFRNWLLENAFYNKCAYCETKIEGFIGDAEHFRPKGEVTFKLDDGDSQIVKILDENNVEIIHPGYFWLAYHWQNILPSCHLCNRYGGKKTQFPVEKSHVAMKRLRVEEIDKLFYKITRSAKAQDIFYLEPKDLDALEGRLLLHPYYDEPDKHLCFKMDGTVDVRTGSEHGNRSIGVYDLNETGKVAARRREQNDGVARYLHSMADALNRGDVKQAARLFMDEYYRGWRPYGAAVYAHIHFQLAGTPLDPPPPW